MLLFLGLPHGTEWIVIIGLGLLLFGRNLPGIARSLGQSVVEFKKGMRGDSSPVGAPTDNTARPVAERQDRVIEVQAASSPAAQAAKPAANVETTRQ